MKKRLLFVVMLLLATSVFAQQNVQSNISLDNVHILRLQDAAASLGGNVTELKNEVARYQEQRSQEISNLQASIDSFQRSVTAQVGAMQGSVDGLSSRIDKISPRPELAVPAEIKFPPYLIILLGVNVFLLVLVIILIFWLREQYYVHRETHAEEHIHPAPSELIAFVSHQLEHNKKLHEIRMELAGKGWTPSIIEHAIHAAKEK